MVAMSAPLSDAVVAELKGQPVASTMPMDTEVNGNGENHATKDHLLNSNPAIVTKPSETMLNGASDKLNMDSFRTNGQVAVATEEISPNLGFDEAAMEAVVPEAESAVAPDVAASTTSHTGATTGASKPNALPSTTSLRETIEPTSDLFPSTMQSGTIEMQESDLREEVVPATKAEAIEARSEKRDLDVQADPDLANSMDLGSKPQTHLAQADGAADADQIAAPGEIDDPLKPASVANLDLSSTQEPADVPGTATPAVLDTEMSDLPASPLKVARGREDDADEIPSAKRAKVEGSDSVDPQSQGTPLENGDGSADHQPPTEYQVKEVLKALRHYRATTHGKNFKAAVSELWPQLAASYAEKITNPVDFGLIEQRLKDGYASVNDLKADFRRLHENTVIFNGPEHVVTKSAEITRDYMLAKIPGPAPPKQEKKVKKSTPKPEAPPAAPRAVVASRRQSVAKPVATSPAAAAPSQTFALDPSGTPLIRRDSTKLGDNGRPKREIHPPKSKDLIYSGARPKKKKYAAELRFCEDLLGEIRKPKYLASSAPFLNPVDPVALGIPDYFKIIKTPMDISTVQNKLNSGQYENAKEFESDMRLIFKNCYKFNPPGSPVHDMGKKFEYEFDQVWAKKGQFLAENATHAASPESVEAEESEEEESEEEEVEEAPTTGTSSAIAARLIEEQTKLIQLIKAKNSDAALIAMQEQMVAIVENQVNAETAKLKKQKPKPAAKPSKKAGTVAKKPAVNAKKTGKYKVKHIGMAEKEQISNGIAALEGNDLNQAIILLKVDFPNLNLEEETELDIDQFSAVTLSKLHDLIAKTHPEMIQTVTATPKPAPKPAGRKKNKPMSKTEQESKIEKLKALKEQFDRQGSTSDDMRAVVPSVEQDQSSGDEESSESDED